MAKALGNTVVVKQPWIEVRDNIETVGIRKVIPTKTVAGEIIRTLASVKKSVEEIDASCLGQPFFRFYAINMGVTYDIEIGYLLVGKLPPTAGLLQGTIPQGTYACLQYLGKNRGYQGNKALIEWIRASGYEMDNWETDLGDTFASRYEVYLSDIEHEPDNKQWMKEVVIKLRD